MLTSPLADLMAPLGPLGPAVVLTLGGLLLWLISWVVWRTARERRTRLRTGFRYPVALASIAAAAWLWMRIGATPALQELSWRWQPLTVAGSVIQWRADAWNWLAVGAILLLAAALVLLSEDVAPQMPSAGAIERILWLAASASTFVCTANVLTLASSWLVLDFALILCLDPTARRGPAGRSWALLTLIAPLLLLVLVLLGESGLPTLLAGGQFSPPQLKLLWLLALLRAGVYPLHFWLTTTERTDHLRVAVHLLVPATGIWLLARIQQLAGPNLVRQPEWAALGVLALLGTALAAWVAADRGQRWQWIAANRASVVLLAAYTASGPHAFAWTLASFGFGGGLLAVGLISSHDRGRIWRLPALFGALILWGLPGTVGFLARSALIYPTELAVAAPLFGLVLIAEVLLIASLWPLVFGEGGAASSISAMTTVSQLRLPLGTWLRWGLAAALLAAPAVMWGLAPRQLAGLGGFRLPEEWQGIGAIVLTARRSVWIGLAVSALGGATLGLSRALVLGQMRGWQQAIRAVVSLEWLFQAILVGLRVAGSGLQYFARLGEGEGYLGWLALAGLILWVLLRG